MVGRSIANQFLGTVVAVLGGWLAPLLFYGCIRLLGLSPENQQPLDLRTLIGSTIVTSFFMAWFIIPVWLFVLIPLYFFVPLSSPLWRWPVCTACGAIGGFLVMTVAFIAVGDRHASWSSGAWEFCGI